MFEDIEDAIIDAESMIEQQIKVLRQSMRSPESDTSIELFERLLALIKNSTGTKYQLTVSQWLALQVSVEHERRSPMDMYAIATWIMSCPRG